MSQTVKEPIASENMIRECAILIPSLEPDNRLLPYVQELSAAGFQHILVIDDGSGENYRGIFQSIEDAGATVLTHEVNKGKGAALKTAYRYLLENPDNIQAVLTADSDGQHTVQDCLKVLGALEQGRDALYLGSRDFSLDNVPPKSRFGNRCTSVIFRLCYGKWLPDTQTGLRAFRADRLSFMAEVDGDRYEYEMNVLIAASRAKMEMVPVTIETIYENDNAGTHFHPIRDSFRIYKVILGNFFRFMAASLICVLIDQVAAALFAEWLLPLLGMADQTSRVWTSGFLARIISSVCNFLLNKNMVFRFRGKATGAMLRYAILCIAVICASNLCVMLLTSIGMARWLAKLLADTALYFASYHFQTSWVFSQAQEDDKK
ncbi:MAG: bifunctional glycosyltransferase family 2/GtrA family protein [Clostridia bacterium]|nr:bifunctional glycosyltransferase family 2/GtrA family protein [Clostridia bacterium]